MPCRSQCWYVVFGALLCPVVLRAQWVQLEEQTDARFACGDQEGANCDIEAFKSTNDDEKDYAWGDLDNDGDVDFVAVHKQIGTTTGRRRNYLFMNEEGILVDRTTQFASASEVTLQDGSASLGFLDLTNDRDVAVIDVNGDEWPDVVTATTLSSEFGKAISHPRIYINLGDNPPGSGNWQGLIFDDEDRAPTMPFEPRFSTVSAGDVDGDNAPDLYFGDHSQGPYSRGGDLDNRLWINDGSGYFTDESELRMTPEQRSVSFCMSAAIDDMNGDGAADVVIDDSHSAPTAVSIVYNNPDEEGFFQKMPRDFIYNQSPYHLSVGDLNNDELPDVVITDAGQDKYLLNQGNGADGLAEFGSPLVLVGADFNFGGNNVIADLDNDGFNDVLVSNVDSDLPSCSTFSKLFHNQRDVPDVTLAQEGNAGIPELQLQGVFDFGVFDINGDDWLDLVLGECGTVKGAKIHINIPPVGLAFSYPDGLPDLVPPGEALTFTVEINSYGGGVLVEGSAELQLSVNGAPFAALPLDPLGENLYEATLPAGGCLDVYAFYVTAEEVSFGEFTDPPEAPDATYGAVGASETALTFEDDIEDDVIGWTIVSDPSLETGEWEQADPIGTMIGSDQAAPPQDAGETLAFVTQNCPGEPCEVGEYDVDGGPTDLITPTFDLEGSDALISYHRWFYTNGEDDELTTWVTNNGDSPEPDWVLVDSTTRTTDGNDTVWEQTSFRVGEFVEPSANVKVRFRAWDEDVSSIVEAGIDLIQVSELVCQCTGDVNGDQFVNITDLIELLALWGACPACSADFNADGMVDINDLLTLLMSWGSCP